MFNQFDKYYINVCYIKLLLSLHNIMKFQINGFGIQKNTNLNSKNSFTLNSFCVRIRSFQAWWNSKSMKYELFQAPLASISITVFLGSNTFLDWQEHGPLDGSTIWKDYSRQDLEYLSVLLDFLGHHGHPRNPENPRNH